MSHIELNHVINVQLRSTDTQLLDNLEAELPADDDPEVGAEYDGPNRAPVEDGSEGEERLSARVVLQTTYTEAGDVNQYGETYATNLYDALTSYDLSGVDSYTIRHYESPTGGVTADAVQAFYEENPDLQPEDEDGESYVPSTFDPTNHIVSEVSG